MLARRLLMVLLAVVAVGGGFVAGGAGLPAGAADVPADGSPRCGAEAPPPGTPVSASSAVPAGGLRVASFNILHGLEDEDDQTLEARLPLAADAVVGARADVVGVQEATVTTNHGDVTRKLAQALAARTGETWSWCRYQSDPHWPGEPEGDGGEGGPLTALMAANFRSGEAEWREMAAVVTRYPITASGARRLPSRAYEAPACPPAEDPTADIPPTCDLDAAVNSRVVLWTRVAVPAPVGPVDVFDTHLSHDLTALSATTKLLQATTALAYAGQVATADAAPDFLLGDFNSTEGSPAYAAVTGGGFVDTFRAVHPGVPGSTADQEIRNPGDTTTERIDYVFARPGTCGLDVAASDVFPSAASVVDGQPLWPSDHHAVVSEVRCPVAAAGSTPSPGAVVEGAARAKSGPSLPATGGSRAPLVALLAIALAVVLTSQVPARRDTTGASASQASPPKTK